MKIMLLIILIFLPSSFAYEIANVTKVIDGDTITLENTEKVRLIGIDTPERGECYYKEAKARLSKLVLNKNVKLEKDISNRDKYKRLLRYVYLNSTIVNDVLVKEGYAKAYYYEPDIQHHQDFKISEISAKKQSIGIWKDCKSSLSIFERLELFFLQL